MTNSNYLERLRESQLKCIEGGVGGEGGPFALCINIVNYIKELEKKFLGLTLILLQQVEHSVERT